MKIGRGGLTLLGLYTEPVGVHVLEGRPSIIRQMMLDALPAMADGLFPGGDPLHVFPCPVEIDRFYVVIAHLRRYEGGAGGYDASGLRVVGFHKGVPTQPIAFLEGLLAGVEWDRLAAFYELD